MSTKVTAPGGHAPFDLFKRALTVALGNSAVSAVDMLMVLALVRFVKPEAWNDAAVVLMIFGTCRGLGQLSIQEGIYFFYGQLPAEQRRGLIAQAALLLAASALVMAGIILTLPHWLPATRGTVAPTLPYLALAVLLELPATCTPQTLIAAERPGWASTYQTLTGIVNSACVAGPLFLGWGTQELVLGILISASVRIVSFLCLTNLALPAGPLRVDLAFLQRQILFTAPLALSVASSVLNRYIDKWIVSGFEPDAVGAYTFAATEVPFVTSLGYAMAAVLSTRVTLAFQAQDKARALAYWMAACTRGALVVGPVTIGILLVAPEVITVYFDDAYAIALVPFEIYNIILLHRVMGYGMLLRSAGRPRILWHLSLSLLGLNTLFSLPLTAYLGLPGAALGTLLATGVIFVLTMRALADVLGVTAGQVFPYRFYSALLVVVLAAAAVAQLTAAASVDSDGQRLALKAACYLLLAPTLLYALGFSRRLPEVPDDTPELLDKLALPGQHTG